MGQGEGLRRLTPEREAFFPRLATSDYEKTSDESTLYNCIAYVADDCLRKWESTAFPIPGYYWPPQAMPGDSLDALQSAFEAIGYELCDGPELESGFNKIALYVGKDGTWSHAAKQRPDGQWSSKLGNLEDIRHATLMDVGDGDYGIPSRFMKRAMPG
jgi:hypothetical protein